MSAYLPRDLLLLPLAGVLLILTPLVGFAITRLASLPLARLAAWLLAVLAPLAMDRLCRSAPAGFRMLAITLVLLYAMKGVVGVEAQAGGGPRLTLRQWLAFAAAWFGMRPGIFARLGRPALPGAAELLRRGVGRLLLGLALVLLAALVYASARPRLGPLATRVAATLILLPGLSLFLHFGVLNIAAAVWRFFGVDCRPLFREPLRSRSLAEFWGRRWNLAFTEMTTLAIYRPLAGSLGKGPATFAGFVLSGLLHETAISLPVQAGYCLPLLYFLLQGGGMLLERFMEQRGTAVGRPAWKGTAWTLAWVALPLPLLFHPPFLRGVVWPLIGIPG